MNIKLFVALGLVTIMQACSTNISPLSWDYSDRDIVGSPPQKSDQIDIDIYIDATTSMQGFAVNETSVYSQFLDQLEASTLTAWKKADPRYFKFGERIRPVDRAGFLAAKKNLEFYRERDIFMRTYIDSVVNRTETSRLSVLITDLFQDEGDVNIMVDRIKSKCFAKGVMVGVVGVKSDFRGNVYDVPGYPAGYPLDSKERPFYMLMFGNQYNMELLFDAMKSKPFVKEDQFLVFTNNIVKSYNVSLTKTPKSQFVNKKAPVKDQKNSFDFSMKEKGTDAQFNLELDVNRNPRCADFDENNLQVTVYKKSANDPKVVKTDSVSTNDIQVQNIQRKGNKVTAMVTLKSEDPVGNYSYLVYLQVNPLNGLKTPRWIRDFSTERPVPNTASASLTYNLDKLTSALLIANATAAPTYLAKFYINIFKR
ncbi:MAG TPA: hypothetical protein VEZ17_04035 [Chitinophagaceae bacterium]|nr:hypothetical protein [Chitinophagaceae bacterium]